MKKLSTILIATSIFMSCSTKSTKPCNVSYERCVVKDVKWEYRYGGLINERVWNIKTLNGYSIASMRSAAKGDTIIVKVIDCRQ